MNTDIINALLLASGAGMLVLVFIVTRMTKRRTHRRHPHLYGRRLR